MSCRRYRHMFFIQCIGSHTSQCIIEEVFIAFVMVKIQRFVFIVPEIHFPQIFINFALISISSVVWGTLVPFCVTSKLAGE